jgi:hypothetical protein
MWQGHRHRVSGRRGAGTAALRAAEGDADVTPLPAKAGSFWLVPEASTLTGASRTTLTATRYVNMRRPDRGLLLRALMSRRTSPEPVFLPSRGEVLNAISTAGHLTEPRLPSTRDMSYPRAFPVEPLEHTVRGKVPCHGATKGIACQAPRCSRSPSPEGDPHTPPGVSPESPAEVFYGFYRWQRRCRSCAYRQPRSLVSSGSPWG